MSKVIVVNLFGAPGAGKSTGAAYIFSELKLRGINCELVTEFAKDKVYEKSQKVFENQAYIFGKQYFRITRVEDEVDVIITDSPLLLSVFYNNDAYLATSGFDSMVKNIHHKYYSINIFLDRVKEYNPSGRFQNESESDQIARSLHSFLSLYDIHPIQVDGNKEGYNTIVEIILREIN